MTGQDLHNHTCNKNCNECQFYHKDKSPKCYIEFKPRWEKWAEEQHREFGKELKDE